MSATCSVEGCEREAKRAGLCWAHVKRAARGQPRASPIKPSFTSPWERITEAIHLYVDAEDDTAFDLARDRLRKAVAAARPAMLAELQREGIERARANGVRLGRPPLVAVARVVELVAQVGVVETSKRLGVSRVTIWRACKKVSKRGHL